MKKFLIYVLMICAVLFMCSVTTFAAEPDDYHNVDVSSINKTDNKTPCYGDYQIVYDDELGNSKAADQEDQYETNNSFSAATRLNYQPSGIPTNINTSINATLHRITWLWGLIKRGVDEDYYRFDLFGNANVNISLTNIPSGCDYDIKLFKFDNIRYAQEDDISQIASSANGSNYSESISTTLQPGTYYIWIYSYNDECNDSVYYNLSVSCNYTAQNETISNLRFNKGAKAAIWISDYDPCGIQPLSQMSKVEVGVRSYGPEIISLSFENPYTNYFTNSDGVEHAVLYIWNVDFRNDIRDTLGLYYNQLANQINTNQRIIANIEYSEAIVGGVSVIAGIIITVFLESNPATAIASIALAITPALFGAVAEAMFPDGNWITTKTDLLNYISNLRTALETSSQTSDNEVVRIVTKYKYSSYSYPATSVTSYYFDFTPSVQSDYLYEDDIISAWNEHTVVNGKVYGIRDCTDMNHALSRVDYYLPDVNTSPVQSLYLNNGIPNELYIGEYHWYSFTAPSSGTYNFYTEGSTDTYGELFSTVVPARSIENRLTFDDDFGAGRNFNITYSLSSGQTVYLRVRGYNWNRCGLYNVRVTRGE